MNTYKLTAERPFTFGGEVWTGVTLYFRGRIRPKAETPKTYKQIGGFVCRERGRYESGCVTLYRTKRNKFVASLYKDGSFYPYYATCTLDYDSPVKSRKAYKYSKHGRRIVYVGDNRVFCARLEELSLKLYDKGLTAEEYKEYKKLSGKN